VFFGSEDKKLYAVAPDGTLVWSFATEGPIDSSLTSAMVRSLQSPDHGPSTT
jgi:outer membrane protein assembly factor BamB